MLYPVLCPALRGLQSAIIEFARSELGRADVYNNHIIYYTVLYADDYYYHYYYYHSNDVTLPHYIITWVARTSFCWDLH